MSELKCTLCGRPLDPEDDVVGESNYRIDMNSQGVDAIEEELTLYHRDCHLTTASIAKVRSLRQNLGIKQKDLAEEAMIEQGYLSIIERGERDPPVSTGNKIIQALKVCAAKQKPD